MSVLAVWMLDSVDVLNSFSNAISSTFHDTVSLKTLSVTINDIAIPIREAMLMFIIWDVYLNARENINLEKKFARKGASSTKKTPHGQKRKK